LAKLHPLVGMVGIYTDARKRIPALSTMKYGQASRGKKSKGAGTNDRRSPDTLDSILKKNNHLKIMFKKTKT